MSGAIDFFRMNKIQFKYIVEAITAQIQKADTNMRKYIKPDERLAITLRYLRIVQYCRIYSIGTIREFRAAIMGETD